MLALRFLHLTLSQSQSVVALTLPDDTNKIAREQQFDGHRFCKPTSEDKHDNHCFRRTTNSRIQNTGSHSINMGWLRFNTAHRKELVVLLQNPLMKQKSAIGSSRQEVVFKAIN